MSDTVQRSNGFGATLAVVLVGLAVGAGVGWWHAEDAIDGKGLEAEMAAALRTIDPVERRKAILAAVTKMRPETLPALRAGLESELNLADSCAVSLFAAAWSAFDPVSAFEAARNDWTNSAKQTDMTTEVAYTLGRAGHVDRARQLASRLTAAPIQFATWGGLAAGLLRNGDLEGATDLLIEQPDTADRNRITESVLRHFILNQDLEGAMAWVDAIPVDTPRQVKKTTFRLAARYIASIDPERAARWLEAQPEGAEYTAVADVAITEEWIGHDPNAAMAWIMARTTPGDRDLAMRNALRRFIKRSPSEAAAWMDRQDPLGDAELGIASLVRALRDEQPAEALAWTARISDPDRRERMTASVAKQWLAADPEAARAWISENPLPESLHERIESERLKAAEGAR